MPFLKSDLIAYLVSLVPDYDVVAPYWQDRFQPLCAVYHRRCTAYIARSLDGGVRKVMDGLAGLKVQVAPAAASS